MLRMFRVRITLAVEIGPNKKFNLCCIFSYDSKNKGISGIEAQHLQNMGHGYGIYTE